MNTPQQTWTEQLIAHLDLAKQVASRLPSNELLETEKLNKILDLLEQTKTLFLLQCSLQGIETVKDNQ